MSLVKLHGATFLLLSMASQHRKAATEKQAEKKQHNPAAPVNTKHSKLCSKLKHQTRKIAPINYHLISYPSKTINDKSGRKLKDPLTASRDVVINLLNR